MKKISIIFLSFLLAFPTFISCKPQTSVTENTPQNTDDGATIDSDLSDANATANAKRLYQYLQDIYGKKIITGQMENAWNDDCDMLSRVYDSVEKYPALMGFDFMNYTSLGWTANNVQTERAIKFWNGQDWDGNTTVSGQHGIVTFCWHWRDPTWEYVSGKSGSYKPEEIDFRIPYDTDSDSWKTSSTDYTEMMADLDVIATELLELQEAGVPVIWRPMHEGAGNVGLYNNTGVAWFWWGAGNSTSYDSDNAAYTVSTDQDICGQCYIALWKLMYEYFTETKGIHNLIWLWNGQNEAFYPGDDYVDIIGDDIYAGDSDSTYGNHSSRKSAYTTYSTEMGSTTKMVCMSECGYLPNPQACYDDSAMWSFFMVWNDGDWDETNSCVTTNTSSSNFWAGTYYNSEEVKSTVYNHEYAITLDELPDLTSYSSEE
ncbi:MAG: glycoside hydrolase family 26 protein [Treponema sp.]|nr:glycoside hydrolase family 26 protein [Treponema sp.]